MLDIHGHFVIHKEWLYLKPEYADTLEICKNHTCVFVFTTPTQLFMKR